MSKLEQRFNKVYAVAYSNYIPYEIDSLWATEKAAEVRAEELNANCSDQWNVVCLEIQECSSCNDAKENPEKISAPKCKMCNTILSETNSLPSAISYCSADNPFKDGIIRFSGDPLCIDCLIELATWWKEEAVKLSGTFEEE